MVGVQFTYLETAKKKVLGKRTALHQMLGQIKQSAERQSK